MATVAWGVGEGIASAYPLKFSFFDKHTRFSGNSGGYGGVAFCVTACHPILEPSLNSPLWKNGAGKGIAFACPEFAGKWPLWGTFAHP